MPSGPARVLKLPQIFVATHDGDYFATLNAYRQHHGVIGACIAAAPEAAYEPIWCAWGYERACTTQLIKDTLPKVRSWACAGR